MCSLEVAAPFQEQTSPPPSSLRPIKRAPKYEAICYTWGDGAIKEDITCDGQILRITSSLATALRKFRLVDKERILWADGICINQKDVKERSHQVMLMAAIYSQATRVLCWLGDDEDSHASHTFKLARRLTEKLEPHLHGKKSKFQVKTHQGIALVNSEEYFLFTLQDAELEELLTDPAVMRHISLLYKKSWFYRMWIRQEFGYASKAQVFCGDSEVDWTHLKRLY